MTAPKKLCFVIMPFSSSEKRNEPCTELEWDAFYERIIEPAVKQIGEYDCKKADNKTGNILARGILEKLCRAHVVIAILTPDLNLGNASSSGHPNPNIMYELGIVHALGQRETLLLVDEKKHIPFDIHAMKVEPYKEYVYKEGDTLNESVTIENFRDYFKKVFKEVEEYTEAGKVRNIQATIESLPSREKLVLLAGGEGQMMMNTAKEICKLQGSDKNQKKLARKVVRELKSKPKCLLTLQDGKTIFEREVDAFIEAGFHQSDIIVVGGYNSPALIDMARIRQIQYVHNKEWQDQEILGALISALKQRSKELKGGFVVAYSDLVFEDFQDLRRLYESDSPISFLVDEYQKAQDTRYNNRNDIHPWQREAEIIVMNKDKVVSIAKAPRVYKYKGEKEEYEFVGVVRFTHYGVAVLQNYLGDNNVQWEKTYLTAMLQAMIDRENKDLFRLVRMEKRWWEIDTFGDLLNAGDKLSLAK